MFLISRLRSGPNFMFWDSVLAGFGLLAHGKIWLGVFLLMAAQFGFLAATATIFGRGESGGRQAAGCLFMVLAGLPFQGFIVSIFVGFYLPMMLGSDEIMSGAVVLSFLWPLAKAGFFATIALTFLCIIPVLGGLIAESPGIQTFILGAIIFRLAVGPAMAEASAKYSINSSVYPNIWSSIGYLIIAGVLVRAILFAGALLSTAIKNRFTSEAGQFSSALVETILTALAPSSGLLGGILPLFMYAQHVRLALAAAVGK